MIDNLSYYPACGCLLSGIGPENPVLSNLLILQIVIDQEITDNTSIKIYR